MKSAAVRVIARVKQKISPHHAIVTLTVFCHFAVQSAGGSMLASPQTDLTSPRILAADCTSLFMSVILKTAER